VLTKSLGKGTVFNRAKATFEALRQLRDPHRLAASRGKGVEELLGRPVIDPYAQQEAQPTAAASAEQQQAGAEEEEQAE
jgi:hypothetical protein